MVGVEEVGGTALVGGKLRGQVVGRKMVATATTVVVERRKQARAMHARARATHLQQATEMHPKARVVHPKAREVHPRARVGHQSARPPRANHHLLAHLGPTAPPLQYLEHLRACKIVRQAALAARGRRLHPQQRLTWSISDNGRMRSPISVRTTQP